MAVRTRFMVTTVEEAFLGMGLIGNQFPANLAVPFDAQCVRGSSSLSMCCGVKSDRTIAFMRFQLPSNLPVTAKHLFAARRYMCNDPSKHGIRKLQLTNAMTMYARQKAWS